jgi:hypothetical protein
MPISFHHLFGVALAVRLLNAALVDTYANPDEHWQAPEIAHLWQFGTGHVTWEWWPGVRLRSCGHPMAISLFQHVLGLLGVQSASAAIAAPRVLHAVLTALQDSCVAAMAAQLFGHPFFEPSATVRGASRQIALWALLAHLSSWFVWFAGVRPIANSLESALLSVGAVIWLRAVPLFEDDSAISRRRLLTLAAAVVAGCTVGLRPTAGIPWVALGAHFMATQRVRATLEMVTCVTLGGLLGLGCITGLDSWCFGEPTLTMWSFLRLNLLHGVDRFYGSYPPLWYLLDGLPATCAALLPVIALGAGAVHKPARQLVLLAAAGWYVAVLSATAHKEHRFLLPLLPLLAVYAGRGIWEVCRRFPPPRQVSAFIAHIAIRAESERGTQPGSCLAAPSQEEADAPHVPLPRLVSGAARGARPASPSRNRRAKAMLLPQSVSAADYSDGVATAGGEKRSIALSDGLPRPCSERLLERLSRMVPLGLRPRISCVGLLLLLVSNAALAAYFTQIHQRGALAAMRHVSDVAGDAAATQLCDGGKETLATGLQLLEGSAVRYGEFAGQPDAVSRIAEALRHQGAAAQPGCLPAAAYMTVHQLMQCHSAPFHSAVHSPLAQLVQLDCSPPIPPVLAHLGYPGRRSDGWISEAMLWRSNPEALLVALYGPAPAPPLVCLLGASAVHFETAVRRALHARFAALQQRRGLDVLRSSGVSVRASDSASAGQQLAVHPNSLERVARMRASGANSAHSADGNEAAAGHGDSAVTLYRALPTHVVAFDSDSEKPAVADFLARNGYHESRRFFYALHGADVHNRADKEPAGVLIFEHACWSRLYAMN